MKHLRFCTREKQVDQKPMGWLMRFVRAVLVAMVLVSGSICSAAEKDTGSWSICLDNASVSDALAQLSDKTGIRITTHGATDSRSFERCYADRSVEEILADILRPTNHAMVWDYAGNRISAVTIWVRSSAGPVESSPSWDGSALKSDGPAHSLTDDQALDRQSEKASQWSPKEESPSQFLEGIDYPEFARKGAASDSTAASGLENQSDPELSDDSEAAVEDPTGEFGESSGAKVDHGDTI